MGPQEKRFYEFGPFQLDASKRLLLRETRPLPLFPKVIETRWSWFRTTDNWSRRTS